MENAAGVGNVDVGREIKEVLGVILDGERLDDELLHHLSEGKGNNYKTSANRVETSNTLLNVIAITLSGNIKCMKSIVIRMAGLLMGRVKLKMRV